MKTYRSAGFTLVELTLVIVVVGVLLALMLPGIIHRDRRTSSINCISNLKQVGLAFRMWSNEHAERFPMELARAEGGTKEDVFQGLALSSFSTISNELNNPKPLTCPEDKERKSAREFGQLASNNLSYFLGLEASELNPRSILSGDRNVCIDRQRAKGLLQIANASSATWDDKIHNHYGNIGFGDGSVQQTTHALLQKALRATGHSTNRFAIP